jgi:hypothetical protein
MLLAVLKKILASVPLYGKGFGQTKRSSLPILQQETRRVVDFRRTVPSGSWRSQASLFLLQSDAYFNIPSARDRSGDLSGYKPTR